MPVTTYSSVDDALKSGVIIPRFSAKREFLDMTQFLFILQLIRSIELERTQSYLTDSLISTFL